MPDVIAGFEVYLRESLGNGSYGLVCEAKHLETGELVAVKQVLLRSHKKDLPPILQEIENMKRVSHENLVKYLDHHQDERGTVWVFVELCDQGDLDKYFTNKNPDRQEYLQLMQQMATAIEFLHCNKIVHRDIKPGNILIKSGDQGPIVKIGDFGLAKMVNYRNNTLLTFSTINIGTRVYMAPELFAVFGVVKCDKSVDIFALGMTFFAIICFKTESDRLIPAEDSASCPESGYGYNMRNLEKVKAMRYHEEVVPVKGDDTERQIRELIREMIQFDRKKRVKAPDVLNSINNIILIPQTAQMQLDAEEEGATAALPDDRPSIKDLLGSETDCDTIAAPISPGADVTSGVPEDEDKADEETTVAKISPSVAADPDSAGQIASNGSQQSGAADGNHKDDTGRGSTGSYVPYIAGAQGSQGAQGAQGSVRDSGFLDSQILQEENLKLLAVLLQKNSVEAVRSDSHRLICAATEIARGKKRVASKVWDIKDHQCWEVRDLVVNHPTVLKRNPKSAGVITILEDRLLLRVRLENDQRQLLAVDSTSGEVLHKTPVYPGRGVPGFCCYKNQILLPDWKKSSSIKQLDAMTLKELNTWTHPEVDEPGSVCSNRNRFAVCHKEDLFISVFKWEEVFLSDEMIYTVEFECQGINLLPDNTLMACNWNRRWSVWNENGDSVHSNVKHPQLAYGQKVYPRAIQDPVSGEWFVQEQVKLRRDWCRVIYNARIVTNRLESGDKTQIDHSLLKLNRTMSYKKS